jgi:hypothetical protein
MDLHASFFFTDATRRGRYLTDKVQDYCNGRNPKTVASALKLCTQ